MPRGPAITTRSLTTFFAGFAFLTGLVTVGLWYFHGRGDSGQGLAASSQPADRLRAIDSLVSGGGEVAGPAIGKLARDSDKVVAVKAVQALQQVGGRRGLDALEAILGDKTLQGRVRAEAAAVLGRLEGADFHILTTAMLGDAEAVVRAGAARGLCSLKEPRSVPALFQALSDRNERVRKAAIDAIHRLVVHHFRYDPKLPPERQRGQIEQIRQTLIRCGLL